MCSAAWTLSSVETRGTRFTVVTVACTWALVNQDGHQLILRILKAPRLQRLRSSHSQDAGHIQSQGYGELVCRLHLGQLLQSSGKE